MNAQVIVDTLLEEPGNFGEGIGDVGNWISDRWSDVKAATGIGHDAFGLGRNTEKGWKPKYGKPAERPVRRRPAASYQQVVHALESNPVSYGKAATGNTVKGSKVAGNAGTQAPITGIENDRAFAPAPSMVQSKPENSEVDKQTKRKVTSECGKIDWSERLKKLRKRRGEPVGEAGPPVPPPPDDEETETFGGDWPPPSDKTAELAELWRDDQAGEYIQINDDGSAYYIAHGRAIEQIAPPMREQQQSQFVGGDPRKRSVTRDVPATESQTFMLIRRWMAKNNYSPNIWSVNDHGNVELYNHNGKPLGGLV